MTLNEAAGLLSVDHNGDPTDERFPTDASTAAAVAIGWGATFYARRAQAIGRDAVAEMFLYNAPERHAHRLAAAGWWRTPGTRTWRFVPREPGRRASLAAQAPADRARRGRGAAN